MRNNERIYASERNEEVYTQTSKPSSFRVWIRSMVPLNLSKNLSKKLKQALQRELQTVRELDKKSRQAVILQHRTLDELLKENRDAEYGRKYGFESILTLEDFKEKVPLTYYEDYEPYIARMMQGEQNLLCAVPIESFALTTGSIGTAKHIPVSDRQLKDFAKYSAVMALGVADEFYMNTTGRGVPAGTGLNAVDMRITKTDIGAEKGNISARMLRSLEDYIPYLLTSAWEIVSSEEKIDLRYLKARLALADRNLVFMDSVFMTGLVDLMDYIRDNYGMLCQDIYYGRINPDVDVPGHIRESLQKKIRPDKARARELLREFRDGFDTPVIPRIWPRMSWIGGIGTGAFNTYARRMREYSGKSIPFNNLCYAASESLIAVARHMGDKAYVLVPDSGFYEFIPMEGDDGRTLTIDELKEGEDYEIVVTNLSGFYRYRLQDVIRVVGFYNEAPLIRFNYRKDQLVSIAGEKTNDASMRWVMEKFQARMSIKINDYSVFADTDSEPAHYVLLVEPSGIVPKEDIPGCRDMLDSLLMRANPAYAKLVHDGVLGKMELVFLQQQTFQLYNDVMIMKGASANQLKPVRVIDTTSKKNFFFRMKETYDD